MKSSLIKSIMYLFLFFIAFRRFSHRAKNDQLLMKTLISLLFVNSAIASTLLFDNKIDDRLRNLGASPDINQSSFSLSDPDSTAEESKEAHSIHNTIQCFTDEKQEATLYYEAEPLLLSTAFSEQEVNLDSFYFLDSADEQEAPLSVYFIQ